VTDEGLSASAGGAHDEAGGQYRRALAALFVAHALNGLEFQGLPLGGQAGTVESVALETDTAVDDIVVVLRGGRLFVQAKRTLRWGRPLEEAARQWLSAVRHADFDSEADFVAAAGGTLFSAVAALGRALDRLRSSATSLTGAERDAIGKLRALLVSLGATDEEIAVITRRAVVLRRAVEEDSEEHAELGRLLLDQHVVKKGEGGRAWRELVAIAGRAARLRVGYTTAGWLTELRKCGVPLTADAEASRAAALERRRGVLERYRQKLVRRGETVDLTRVGARLPPIPLADIDAGIDVRDPADVEGPEVCRRVLAASPGTAVVMLTSYCEDNIILKSLNAGAKGYLIKDVELAEVKRPIRAVYRGHSVLDPKVAPRVIADATNGKPGASLSERDVAIIRYVAGGLTNKEIGALVHLSAHTIKDRLEKIAAAFEVRSRAEIVAEAFRAGLI